MHITAVVLAAGKSRRMGCDKRLLPFGEGTVLSSILAELSQSRVNKIVVVADSQTMEVADIVRKAGASFVANPTPDIGMLSSVKIGLQDNIETDAYLVALGDQPTITSDIVDQLIMEANACGKLIVVPVYNAKRGHPIIVTHSLRETILNLSLSVGLNALIASMPEHICEFPVDSPAILDDLDTMDDYLRLLSRS